MKAHNPTVKNWEVLLEIAPHDRHCFFQIIDKIEGGGTYFDSFEISYERGIICLVLLADGLCANEEDIQEEIEEFMQMASRTSKGD